MFSFSASGGWKDIDDFLCSPEADDCSKEKELAGFNEYAGLSVGDTDSGSFCIEVYNRDYTSPTRKESQYEFLVAIDIGNYTEYVAVPKLPDLLELLRQVIPLSVSIDEWTVMKEKYQRELLRNE